MIAPDFIYPADAGTKPSEETLSLDYFPTPKWAVSLAADYAPTRLLSPVAPRRILDAGAGDGRWGRAFKKRFPTAELIGFDIRDLPKPQDFDGWIVGDYTTIALPTDIDLVVGNPPFSIARLFWERSLEILSNAGTLLMMLRTQFMDGENRALSFWAASGVYHYVHYAKRVAFIDKTKHKKGEGSSPQWSVGLFFANGQPVGNLPTWDILHPKAPEGVFKLQASRQLSLFTAQGE